MPQTVLRPLDDATQTTTGWRGGLEQPIAEKALAEFPAHPGFPIYFDKWTERASATIVDSDNNGNRELLLPTYTGEIYAWNTSGGLLLVFPLTAGWGIRGRQALGDLNYDGNQHLDFR